MYQRRYDFSSFKIRIVSHLKSREYLRNLLAVLLSAFWWSELEDYFFEILRIRFWVQKRCCVVDECENLALHVRVEFEELLLSKRFRDCNNQTWQEFAECRVYRCYFILRTMVLNIASEFRDFFDRVFDQTEDSDQIRIFELLLRCLLIGRFHHLRSILRSFR